MQSHIKVLGWLHIILNVLTVLAGVLLLFLFFSGGALLAASGDKDAGLAGAIIGGVGLFLGGIFLVVGLPGVIVGWGLLNNAPWSRIGGIILSILSLFNFPVGTAIGIYGMVILCNAETAAIFEKRALPPYAGY